MTREKVKQVLHKLKKLDQITVARGATPEEAATAYHLMKQLTLSTYDRLVKAGKIAEVP